MEGRSSVSLKVKQRENRKQHKGLDKIIVLVKDTQYPVIAEVARSLGWSVTYESNENWHIYWTDSGLHIDNVLKKAKIYQRVNHIPGMVNIYRKSFLTRSMVRMQKLTDRMYDFYPRSWILPHDYEQVCQYLEDNKYGNKCVIVKPSGGAQGKGIQLVMSSTFLPKNADAIAQEYVMKPYLLDGYKFDLRIYALVISVDPLRVFVYREGLVRLCTNKYEVPHPSNIDCSFMHLTNYAVNKWNSNFVQNNDVDENTSSKRSLAWLWSHLADKGQNPNLVWRRICDVVVKTLISIQAHMAHINKTCKVDPENRSPFTAFEVLGFDILLSDILMPTLLEVNHTPSFRTDSILDRRIKFSLIRNTMKLLNVSIDEKRRHFHRMSSLSQIRLYGDTFSSHDRCKSSSLRLESTSEQWSRYLESEHANIGNYDLVFPADVYENQPTKGLQNLYQQLLEKSSFYYNTSGLNVPQDVSRLAFEHPGIDASDFDFRLGSNDVVTESTENNEQNPILDTCVESNRIIPTINSPSRPEKPKKPKSSRSSIDFRRHTIATVSTSDMTFQFCENQNHPRTMSESTGSDIQILNPEEIETSCSLTATIVSMEDSSLSESNETNQIQVQLGLGRLPSNTLICLNNFMQRSFYPQANLNAAQPHEQSTSQTCDQNADAWSQLASLHKFCTLQNSNNQENQFSDIYSGQFPIQNQNILDALFDSSSSCDNEFSSLPNNKNIVTSFLNLQLTTEEPTLCLVNQIPSFGQPTNLDNYASLRDKYLQYKNDYLQYYRNMSKQGFGR